MSHLSPRSQAFIRAYIGEARGNATTAAVLAGYSAKTARQAGSRLLTNVDIRAAIAAADEARVQEAIASAYERDTILSALARNGQLEARDRIKAISELNKCTGRHVTKHEHSGRLTLEELVGGSMQPAGAAA